MNNGGRADYFKDEMNAHSMFPRRMTNASEIGAAIIFLIETSMMKLSILRLTLVGGTSLAGLMAVTLSLGHFFSLELKRVNKIADDNY